MIYEYALVRDVVGIVWTIHPYETKHPSGRARGPRRFREPNPKKTVTLRSRHIRLENVKYIAGKEVGDEVSESYGIHPDQCPPVVNLFLTSRKVYSETWPIFYQQNAFSFTLQNLGFVSVANCLRFLYDRPYHALRHIRELHLVIGDCFLFHVRYQVGSELWQHLVDELTRYMSVRVLVLQIRGRIDDQIPLSIIAAPADVTCGEWLCKITGLQKLHMDIYTDSTEEEIGSFVKQVRSKMVVGGDQMGSEGFVFSSKYKHSDTWASRW